MLTIQEFDLKTQRSISKFDPVSATEQPKVKTVENAYLEYWLQVNGIDANFYVARFYGGVTDADRVRSEANGRVLVLTHGKDGYFTDPETARLLTLGDQERGIIPIYNSDRHSPHNLVAYGSLVTSDGLASAAVNKARLLIINDEQRSHGDSPLYDLRGDPVAQADLEKLYDKMGDGTLLISKQLMKKLITEKERESITAKVFQKHQISDELATLSQERQSLDQALTEIERDLDRLAGQLVTQFRAASPSLPGIAKGTMTASQWCDRLGVDAIISSNDIKGDSGYFSEPGIKEISHFWVNRKSDAHYGEQVVGPQVKGCIPEATLHEFNPRMKAQAEKLEAVASQPELLRQYYLERKEKQRRHLQKELGSEGEQDRHDWLYEVLKADRYGLLNQFSKVNYEFDRFLRGERIDNAVRGIYVPSAMAQHHSQLKPWEVCNKDLPHGAIVAYYRSPFPNVGAAAIAINNTEVLRQQDPESYHKQGVAYLAPWTAKHIAITDFDRDTNGYFVGYLPTIPDLPEQIRVVMQEVKDLLPGEQYEAGRAHFGEMIQQLKSGTETRIKAGEYPLAVAEIIERNAPERKPTEILKQKKNKHPWHEEEPHSAATWRAWSITAENPTGRVANTGIVLQSLALECEYIADVQKESLLRGISHHYAQLLKRVQQGKLEIPDDTYLQERSFPSYKFVERISTISAASLHLNQIKDPQERQQFIVETLQQVSHLLNDLVNGPCAENLQTAVDTAKSSRGIDEKVQSFAKALAHKDHLLRQHHKDRGIYLDGQCLPTNTEEPIGWAVQTANQFYQESRLPELGNETFRDLFPKDCTPEQEAYALSIADHYNRSVQAASEAQMSLGENRREDRQPTLLVTVPATGSQVVIQRLVDADPLGISPIWSSLDGQQKDWQIWIGHNQKAATQNSEVLLAKLFYTNANGNRQESDLGYVSPQSAQLHSLAERLQNRDYLVIKSPIVELIPPFALQNDTEQQLARAAAYLKESIAAIPSEERMAYASALWRQSKGMGIVLKHFIPELAQRLQQPPEITITGIQRETNEVGRISDGEYIVKFSQYSYSDSAGATKVSPSVAIVSPDGEEQQFGAISPRCLRLPTGTTARADIITPLADSLTATINQTQVTVKKLNQCDLTQTTWQQEKVELLLGYSPAQIPLAQVVIEGRRKTIGELDAASAQELRQRGLLPMDSWRSVEAVLERGLANVAVLQVKEVLQPAPIQESISDTKSTHSISFQAQEQTQSYQAVLRGDRDNPSAIVYFPTRQELIYWFTAAQCQGDEQRMGEIRGLGKTLKNLYNLQQGTCDSTPPADYQHLAVSLSDSEVLQMRRDIAAFQAAVQRSQRHPEVKKQR